MTRHDVVIVGAGPAGLATAIGVARAGLDVAVIDARRPPLDKACGEGLMPDGAAALESIGVAVPVDGGARFDGIRWIDGDVVVDGSFPGAPGLGIRRTRLHAALLDAAGRVGVDVRWDTTVRGLDDGRVRTNAGVLDGRWVVGADGLRSCVRRLAGLAAPARSRPRFGLRRHVRVTPWSSRVEVWWDDEGEAYVTPIGEREVGIALLSAGRPARFDELERRFPALARRIGDAPSSSSLRGAGPLEQRVRAVRRGRTVLVGDAAGYLDAITGEGLALAFRQAVALAATIASDEAAAWPAAHRRVVRRAERMTRVVLAVGRRPAVRRRLLRALAADSGSFDRLLAVHVGAAPAASVGAHALARLAWRLVRPAQEAAAQ